MESFGFALKFSATGIVIVFAVLWIIALVITWIRKAEGRWRELERHQEAAMADKDQNIDNTTLVIISATVAAMIKGRFYIRRVRRLLPVDAPHGTWSAQGRAFLHGSHQISKKRER